MAVDGVADISRDRLERSSGVLRLQDAVTGAERRRVEIEDAVLIRDLRRERYQTVEGTRRDSRSFE